MIQYTLICENKHTFDAWFKSSKAYSDQRESGILECPICNTQHVSKALMAPAIALQAETSVKPAPAKDKTKVSLSAGHPEQQKIRAALKQMRETVVNDAEYVGDRFADEARKIHNLASDGDTEADQRSIYGEATTDEIKSLVDDGVDFVPLPVLPEDHN